jgi:site-specific recombinase XerD
MKGPYRQDGSLTPYVGGYRDWLLGCGYTPSSTVHALTALGHLGRWMENEGIGVDQLDEAAVRRFVGTQVRVRGRLPLASVRPLLEYLQATGAAPVGTAGSRDPAPEDELLDGYREWLVLERRLAPSTIRGREQIARRFLTGCTMTPGEIGLSITAAEVTAFLARESGRLSPGSMGAVSSRLRSLLRYLAMRGLADPRLAEAIPRIASWREAMVPRFPEPAAVDALLASCDRSTVVGARDYAVLMLLSRLGLRAIEVSRLELSDLDWRAGEIEVDGKAHHRGRLPLPVDVGEALVAYLRVRGPARQRLFMNVKAPPCPLEPTGVRSLVRHAYQRAGLDPVGAHQLRHALASDLLRAGASLVAIGQVLRHQHLESTAIYAKVDLERLRSVASPWPGARR